MIFRTDAGLSDGRYENVECVVCDIIYKIYHRGIFDSSTTNLTANVSGNLGDYIVTASINSQSVYSKTDLFESNPWQQGPVVYPLVYDLPQTKLIFSQQAINEKILPQTKLTFNDNK